MVGGWGGIHRTKAQMNIAHTQREGTHLVHNMRLRKLLAASSAEERRNKRRQFAHAIRPPVRRAREADSNVLLLLAHVAGYHRPSGYRPKTSSGSGTQLQQGSLKKRFREGKKMGWGRGGSFVEGRKARLEVLRRAAARRGEQDSAEERRHGFDFDRAL